MHDTSHFHLVLATKGRMNGYPTKSPQWMLAFLLPLLLLPATAPDAVASSMHSAMYIQKESTHGGAGGL